ncbi:putative restriction endonuclease domain-containing protein [Candidatus Magnetomoraceae bacterium gMMP-15]
MSLAQELPLLSEKEYLEIERKAEYKSEYYNGEIFAMSGASRKHNIIVSNLITQLNLQLEKTPCIVYPSDMRLKVQENGLYTYPDLMITCKDEKFDDKYMDTLLNPLIIIEVLSKSTESYDRGEKFSMYRKLESLREYLLISQDIPLIEQYVRQDDGKWLLSDARGMDSSIILNSVKAQLKLENVYNKVLN